MAAKAPSGSPKYLKLKQDLEEQIRSGRLGTGAQLATDRELMKQYGLSYSTVTRAMAELHRTGLIEREWGRGTFVKQRKAMVTNIALAFDRVHRPTDPYLVPIVKGVGEAAGEKGYHWQAFPLAGESIFGGEQDSLFVRLLESRQLHGVVSCSPFPADDIARLAELGIPAVTLSVEYPKAHTPWVIEDVSQGAGDLVRYLVDELSHRRIALVMGPECAVSAERIRSSSLLFDELMRQLRQRGIHVPSSRILHCDMIDLAPVVEATHRWLIEDNRPTAVICAADRMAIEVLEVAATHGVSVPHDLSVATWYDRIDNSPLTSVRVPLEEMGHDALAIAARALAGETVAPFVRPVQLIVRQTTSRAID